MTGKTFSLNE